MKSMIVEEIKIKEKQQQYKEMDNEIKKRSK
jgi:hypothetical protein